MLNLTPKSPLRLAFKGGQVNEGRQAKFVNYSHQRLKASGYSSVVSPVNGLTVNDVSRLWLKATSSYQGKHPKGC